MTKRIENRLRMFHHICLRRILNVFYPNLVSNKEILRRTDQEDIVVEVADRKWRWVGHMARKGPENLTRQVFTWVLQGQRKGERPRETWLRVANKEEALQRWWDGRR
jgi:hypothetical protein